MTQSTIIRGPSSWFLATRPKQRRGVNPAGTWLIMAALIAVSFQALPLQAQIRDWNNTSSTFAWYDFGPNWNPAGAPGSSGDARFQQIGTYQVWWDAGTASATPSVGTVKVLNGNATFLNLDTSPQHQMTINGSLEVLSGSLTVRGIHLRNLGGASVLGELTLDGSHSAGTVMSVEGSNALEVYHNGSVNVLGGSVLNSSRTIFYTGNATVDGVGSHLNTAGELTVGAGFGGIPGSFQLDVTDGGRVSSSFGTIGNNFGTGIVNVVGNGSQWNIAGGLLIGFTGYGSGYLNVQDGGLVTSEGCVIGEGSGPFTSGTVTVTGIGSRWSNAGALTIGSTQPGSLAIQDGGLVTVGGTTTIGPQGSVTIGGGRFEFGTTDLASFNRITGPSGSLAGNVNHAGYTNVASLTGLQNPGLEMTDVNLVNSGGLYGNAVLRNSLRNTTSGEVETVGNERMRFAGSGTNAGQINVFGGQVRFGQSFRNEDGGEVNNFGNSFVAGSIANDYGGIFSGRGQFVANGGWYNAGVMAFSDGTTDIVGDVYNSEGATIVTSGNGTTTFYGDFEQENGGTVRTSAGSSTVFFGEVSGGGSFVGDGTVFMEGDLRPGNSPGTMSFGGDLVLSSSASTMIELGGLGVTDFDRLLIGGDLFLGDSSLEVALWDGFVLGDDMQFLFADVEGELFGQFSGLGEGSLVGNFGGNDLFITYEGFGGNGGVGLFTAVPEPSALALLGIAGVVGLVSRRRRNR